MQCQHEYRLILPLHNCMCLCCVHVCARVCFPPGLLHVKCESQEVQNNSILSLTSSNVWKKLPSLRYSFCTLCAIDDIMLAIGGIDEAGRVKTSSIYALSMITVTWKRIGDLHSPCVCLAVLLPGSELLCLERGAGTRVFKGKPNGKIW